MDQREDTGFDAGATGDPHGDAIERMAEVVAHLAAQLTIAQLQLRALGTVLSASGAVDEGVVRRQLADLARAEAGTFLAQNLGEALEGIVATDELADQIVAFLAQEPTGG